MKMSQQLKLSNFLKRKGDNDDTITGASKQYKSSSIDDVEIVHASPVSKAVRVKPKAAVAAKKMSKDSFRIHDFPILPGSCTRMAK
jgi:hypothetical protein